MRALVTGAGGFVGAHLARQLVAAGWEVTGTVRPGSAAERLAGVDLTCLPVDLADPTATTEASRSADPDVVFLLAGGRARSTPAERHRTWSVNATSVLWLLDALPERCRTVIRLGSATEYAASDAPIDESAPLRPREFFGASKAAGSLLLAAAAARRRVAILRAFQVYGPLDHPGRLVPSVLRAAHTGDRLPLTEPGRRRDWVFVDDVVDACIRVALADELPSGQVLNIGSGRQYANEELVNAAELVTGLPIAVDAGGHPGSPYDSAFSVCDPSLARRLLGWEAKVELDEGLRRCWEAVTA